MSDASQQSRKMVCPSCPSQGYVGRSCGSCGVVVCASCEGDKHAPVGKYSSCKRCVEVVRRMNALLF